MVFFHQNKAGGQSIKEALPWKEQGVLCSQVEYIRNRCLSPKGNLIKLFNELFVFHQNFFVDSSRCLW